VRISGHENDLKHATKKHNISEPSVDDLEKKIKIPGHERDVRDTGKHKVVDPSVDELEKKIQIAGHEHEKLKDTKKHNVSEPSVDNLESQIKIAGHENEKLKKNPKVNMKEPSVDELESKIKIPGHEHDPPARLHHNINEPNVDLLENQIKVNKKDTEKPMSAKEKKEKMEPSIDRLEDADLLRRKHPRFKHMAEKPLKIDSAKLEPSINLLEKEIAIKHVEENTTTVEPLVILPGYEGFHGIVAHNDEAYQHGAHADHGGHQNKTKSADLDDYKTWLDNENKVSKLARFKRLHEEFAKLSANRKKKKSYHDDEVLPLDASSLKEEHLQSMDGNNLIKLEEKLLNTIRRLEEEEEKQRKRLKIDL
jgi:hypothetical protein